jgi:hypothetical protein
VKTSAKSELPTLSTRLRQAISSDYLTMLSIAQGVALAYLASVVTSAYAQFSLVQWLMTLFTFFLFIVIWNLISMDATALFMVPNFGDSILPFAAGGVEIFSAHAISVTPTMGIGLWLWGLAVGAFFSVIGLLQFGVKARREAENAALLEYIRRARRNFVAYQILTAGCVIALATVGFVVGYGTRVEALSVQAVWIVLIEGGLMVGTALASALYWRRVVAFSQTQADTISA